MSNSIPERIDSSSNVVEQVSQVGGEASASTADSLETMNDKSSTEINEIKDIKISLNSSNSQSPPTTTISGNYFNQTREGTPRGRGKSQVSRRPSDQAGVPSPQYDRYKQTNFIQNRNMGDNPGLNRGGQQYSHQKNRQRNGDGPIIYSPGSPQHSIGSLTPTSIHASPIQTFPTPPPLPESLHPFGQSHFASNMQGGMTRPVDSGYFVPGQIIDPRYVMASQQIHGVQFITMPGVQHINQPGGKPVHVMPMGQILPGQAPGTMMGMPPQMQQFYPGVHQQDGRGIMQIPQPMYQPNIAFGAHPQQIMFMNPPSSHMKPQYSMPPHSYQQEPQSIQNTHHSSTPPEQVKPKSKFVIKDKKGNVFEDLTSYANVNKKLSEDISDTIPENEVKSTDNESQMETLKTSDESIVANEVQMPGSNDTTEPEAPSVVAIPEPTGQADSKFASLSAIPVFIPPSLSSSSIADKMPAVSSNNNSNSWRTKKEQVSEPITNSRAASLTSDKSKKALLREKIAAADANANRGDNMLDAYTTTPPPLPLPPQTIQPIREPEKVEAKQITQESPIPEQDDDDWEIAADKISSGLKEINLVPAEPVAPARVSRSLRPQGNTKLNTGPTNKPLAARITYSREFILKQRSLVYPPDAPLPERPPHLSMYSFLSSDTSIPVTSSSGQTNKQSSSQAKQQASQRQINSETSYQRGEPSTEAIGDSWKRDNISTNAPRQGQAIRNARTTVPPPPKRVISDPIEALSLQVRSILNKITPQTFEKLAGQIKDIKINSSKLCERLVYLIFEKAICEQNFSNLYAGLCNDLEKQLSTWPFINVLFFRDSNQYTWVIDVDVESTILAGPYHAPKDCINAAANEVLPLTRHIPYKLGLHELIVSNNVLIKIFKNLSVNDEQYFCSFMATSDIPPECMSTKRFSTIDEARKSGRKINTIKSRLLRFCENEFYESSEKAAKYEAMEIAWQEFEKTKHLMSPDEAAAEVSRLEELQDKLKRRTLGTIRFIGELFKVGLATTPVVIDCMTKLLCDVSLPSGAITFKSNPPDIDLEVLCKLVRTVGKDFCEQSKAERLEQFNWCMKRMQELSQDKKKSARIRFSLEEVLQLRENNWVERRQEEGPLTIDEIHRRIEEENRRAGLPPSTYSSSSKSSHGGYSAQGRTSNSAGGRQSLGPGRGAMDRQTNKDSRDVQSRRSDSVLMQRGSINDDRAAQPLERVDSLSSRPSASSEIDMLKASLEDYFRSPTESDICEVTAEMPSSTVAQMVVLLLTQYVNSTNNAFHSIVLDLLPKLKTILRRSKVDIENELSKMESLRILTDFVLDMKQAPELFGNFLGKLVSLEVLDMEWIVEFTRSVHDENLEFASEADTISAYKLLVDTAMCWR